MSDSDDDVVVLRTCARTGCMSVESLEFDEQTGEMYCEQCRELFARANAEGFHVLLCQDDIATIRMIFTTFDKERKGYWTFADFNVFQDSIEKCGDDPLRSSDDLFDYFKSEYDISLRKGGSDGEYVVVVEDLEDMYGGYIYNSIPALRDDAEHLGEAGFINLGLLE